MQLWKKFTELTITRKLRFLNGATLDVNGTEIDLTELAAINSIAAADLEKIDGITNGTAAAGKAVVLGASKEIATITSATITTLTSTTVNTSAVVATAGIKSSGPTGAGIGYATGAGGVVTQITNRSTGVTINKLCGTITGDATSLAGLAEAIFVVTNSTVAITDTIVLSLVSGPTANTSQVSVSAVAAGSFSIKIRNMHASTADTGAPVINFAVLKSVAA